MAGGPVRTPMPTPPPPPLRPASSHGPRPRWGRRALWSSGVALLFLVMFLAVVDSRRDSRRETAAGTDPQAETSPPAEAPGDADLQEGIERLLESARATRDHDIEVHVHDRVATLTGEIEDPSAAQVAEALAESYPGIKSVQNQIELPGGRKADQAEARKEAEKAAEAAAEIAVREGRRIVIPLPPVIAGRPPEPGSPQAEAVTDLLREGKEALEKNEVEDAMALYSAALSLDPRNRQARVGIQEAARRMRLKARQMEFHWIPPSTWPFTGEHPVPQLKARPSAAPPPPRPAQPSTPPEE
jgi:hypothetical protein